LRSYHGISPSTIKDWDTRRELMTMDQAIHGLVSSLKKLQDTTVKTPESTALSVGSPPPVATSRVAIEATSSQGEIGPSAVVSLGYEAEGLTAALPDTAMGLVQPGLYRLNIYVVMWGGGTGTFTVRGNWEDGTTPGAYFDLGSAPANTGTPIMISVPVKLASGDIQINTTCTGTYPTTYSIFVKVENL